MESMAVMIMMKMIKRSGECWPAGTSFLVHKLKTLKQALFQPMMLCTNYMKRVSMSKI